MTDLTFAAITAPLDERLSPNDLHILDLVVRWSTRDVIRDGDITLNALCWRTTLPSPYVFLSVSRLVEFGYLPTGAIR